jgi:hypothetical protein
VLSAVALSEWLPTLAGGHLDGREGSGMGLQSLTALLVHRVQLHEPFHQLRPAHAPTLWISNLSASIVLLGFKEHHAVRDGQHGCVQLGCRVTAGGAEDEVEARLSGAPGAMPMSTHHFSSGSTR